jgi:hypothetical protein
MGEHVTRILCAAAPRGSTDAIEQLREVAADQNIDATVATYLREAFNVEAVSSLLHWIHGTLAFTSGQSVIAGLGGEISDDLDANRDEIERLRNPRWEAEYRLKILDEHAEHERMLVVCGGPRRTETLGRSTVVAPGDLAAGHYALADIRSRDVELGELIAA